MRFKTFLSVGVIFLFSSMLVLAALDLRFTTAINQSPDPASAGDAVTFTVSFRTFDGPVTNLKVTGGVDGTKIFERLFKGIPADNLRTCTFSWTATTGSHKAWFVLDPDHKAGDSDYSNNKIEKTLTVHSSKTPYVSQAPANKPVKMIDKSLLIKYITVTDPHIGDKWYTGSKYTIKWDTNMKSGVFFIIDLYSTDKTTRFHLIGQTTSKSYLWQVTLPSTLTIGYYRIRVSSYEEGSVQSVDGFSDIFRISDLSEPIVPSDVY